LRTADHIDHQELSVTVSMGIAVFPDDGSDAEVLLKNADTALLNAKALGRGNHQFFQPGMNSRGG
jgi:GGDEF domain-containing protein